MSIIRELKKICPLYIGNSDNYSVLVLEEPQREINVFSFLSSSKCLCYSTSFSLLSDQWNSNIPQVEPLKRWFDDIQQFWLYIKDNKDLGYRLSFMVECKRKVLQVTMKARKDSNKSVKIGEILLEQKQMDSSLILQYIAQRCRKKRKIGQQQLAILSVKLLDICNSHLKKVVLEQSNQKVVKSKVLQQLLQDFSALMGILKEQQQFKKVKQQSKRQPQEMT